MLQLAFIVVSAFAVLGAYYLTEVLLEVFFTKKCSQLVILFPKKTKDIHFASEAEYARNGLPSAEVVVCVKDTFDVNTAMLCKSEGVVVLNQKELAEKIEIYLSEKIIGK
ncbi:MAG: hypothetical protein RR052_05000 [Oscillospiraceae bacterium]